MKDLFKKLLEYYAINEDEFAYLTREVNESSFVRDYSFKNMEDAVSLLKDVVSNNGRILIYGDYDADGIMGTSILTKMFQYENYANVSFYIPCRYKDGYGINVRNAEKIAKEGYDLVICVDNGISAFDAIKCLKEHNIKVLILDHHEIQSEVPEADVILHPFYSEYGKYSCSGACVAFNFSIHFLGRFDKYLSTLAAISTVSDMMPLRDYNRDLLRIAFVNYKDGEFLQIDLLKSDKEDFNEKSIGMQIAPKINSIGRLIDDFKVNDIVRYFISENRQEILTYYTWIDETNIKRKELSKTCFENLKVDTNRSSIVEIVDEKEGLVGLIANACLSKYKKPSIIFTYDEISNTLKGSCRSLPGCSIMDSFSCMNDILLTYGGHSLAGGCSLSKDNYEIFRDRFDKFIKAHPYIDVSERSIDISLADVNYENYELINRFGPFGEDWKEPLFNLSNIKVEALKFSRDGNHILTPIGMNSKIVGFNISRDELSDKNTISLQGSFKESSYKGVTSLDFSITKLF